MKLLLLLLFTLHISSPSAEGANILGFFGHQGKSHFDVFEALMKELAKRGHSVTVVSYFPQKSPLANYTDISLKGLVPILLNSIPFDLFEDYKAFMFLSPYINFIQLRTFGLESCENILASRQVKDLLKEPPNKFDLIVTEIFNTDCFLGVLDKFRAPVIGFSSCSLMPWFNRRFGNPSNPSFVPNIFYGSSENMTFSERLHNTFLEFLTEQLYHPLFDWPAQNMLATYVGEDVPPVEEIAKKTSLLLLNTHFTTHGAKPVSPNVIEVGGLHIPPAKKLPEDIEKFLNESEHGVILFSLGSMLQAETLPDHRRKAFLNAFKEIPERVIWKFEKDLPDLPKNVKIYPWLPQRDILAHPKVKAFIAHGGLLGLTEGLHCGKPVLGIPMFGDQFANIRAAVHSGYAVELPFVEVTKETVLDGVKKVTSNEYFERAQALSEQFRDRPMPPMETAVYWTEYVIRHKGAPQLRPAAVHLKWYQYYLIDVLLVAAAAVLIMLYVSYCIAKLIAHKLLTALHSSEKSKLS